MEFSKILGVKTIKTYVLIYDSFVQFEIVLACYLMKSSGEIVTVGMNKDPVHSFEGFITVPHIMIDEINIDEVDLFLMPGGDPGGIGERGKLYKLLRELDQKGVVIGAICSAPIHLAKASILKGKRYTTTLPLDEFPEFEKENYEDDNIIIGHNIITAKASAYVDFAIELGKMMNIYQDEEDLLETIRYFKYYDQKLC